MEECKLIRGEYGCHTYGGVTLATLAKQLLNHDEVLLFGFEVSLTTVCCPGCSIGFPVCVRVRVCVCACVRACVCVCVLEVMCSFSCSRTSRCLADAVLVLRGTLLCIPPMLPLPSFSPPFVFLSLVCLSPHPRRLLCLPPLPQRQVVCTSVRTA